MGRNFDLEAYLADTPVLVAQRSDDPLYFDWIHTPGRPECEEILQWFESHSIKPFIAEQSRPGDSEFAGHGFYDQPDLGVLFKLRFV